MNTKLLPSLFFLMFFPIIAFSQFDYERYWGSYFGDLQIYVKAAALDHAGNVYLAGTAVDYLGQPLFAFTTPEAHQATFGGGAADGFIVKFTPEGELLWGTYFGGEGDDRIEEIVITEDKFIYVSGVTTSLTNIASPGAFQEELNGPSDAFLAKFNLEGKRLWSTYFGGDGKESTGFVNSDESGMRLAVQPQGNIFFSMHTLSEGLGTEGTFQPEKQESNHLISSFSPEGERIWSTYYGINLSDISGIAITDSGIMVGGWSVDCPPLFTYNTYFGTPGAHLEEPNFCRAAFLSKFNFNGQRVWSTYYGGHGGTIAFRNSVATFGDAVYFGGVTVGSSSGIATEGAYQETSPGTSHFVVKFNADGRRQWGTYCGTRENIYGDYAHLGNIGVDASGNVFLSGSTYNDEMIASPDGYQTEIAGLDDAFVVKFSPDGEHLWGTYYGGPLNERNALALPFEDNFYLIGRTKSLEGIATPESFQTTFETHPNLSNQYAAYFVRFGPERLATESRENSKFVLYPNPNTGRFTISLPEKVSEGTIEIQDLLGRILKVEKIQSTEVEITLENLPRGIYLAKIKSAGKVVDTKKVMVR